MEKGDFPGSLGTADSFDACESHAITSTQSNPYFAFYPQAGAPHGDTLKTRGGIRTSTGQPDSSQARMEPSARLSPGTQ